MKKKLENIKRLLILLGILLLILIGILIISLTRQNITGETVKEYTHTKAVCNENNFCQDYEVTCQGEKVVDIKPTGYIVQNPDDWKDPRNQEEIGQWCNVSE